MDSGHYFGGGRPAVTTSLASGTTPYARLKPCIDMAGHHFQANATGFVCCTRCGTRPPR